MITGRFFKVDTNFKDFSIYHYLPIVSCREGKDLFPPYDYPIFLKLSPTFIGFYLHTKVENLLLFYLPINDQYGEDRPSEILKKIFLESYDSYPKKDKAIVRLAKEDFNFLGYKFWFNEQLEPHRVYKRSLFLDFLFDLLHSEVFNTYPSINDIKYFVYNNFFVRSILFKNEYYFSRNEYIKFTTKHQHENQHAIFSQRLKEAEEQWLEMLFREEASSFYFSNGWFSGVEEEMGGVLFSEKVSKKNKQPKEIFNRRAWQKDFFSNLPDSDFVFEQNKLIKEQNDLFSFFLKRYEFFNLYKLIGEQTTFFGHLGKMILGKWGIILLIAFTLSSICFWKQSALCLILILGVIGIWWAVVLPFLYALFETNRQLVKSSYTDYLDNLKAATPTIWARGPQASPGVDTSILHLFQKGISHLKKRENIYPYLDYTKSAAPKMTITILTGWLALFPFSEELWELNSLPQIGTLELLLFLILLSTIFFTIIYAIKLVEPVQKLSKTLLKVIRIFIIGFSFSIGFGIIVQNHTAIYMFNNQEFLDNNLQALQAKSKIDSIINQPKSLYALYTQLDSLGASGTKVDILNVYEAWNPDKSDQHYVWLEKIIHDDIFTLKTRISILKNEIGRQINEEGRNTYKKTKDVLRQYADHNSSTQNSIQVISLWHNFDIFFFPKMLLFNALVAFIIGFFIQFVLEARAFKENV